MTHQQSNKTISFLMELIIVLLFFTLASATSVYVVNEAQQKNEVAIQLRNALVYGNNLIQDPQELKQDHFYLDKQGMKVQEKGFYEVRITQSSIDGLNNQFDCELSILHDGKSLVTLSFLKEGEIT